VSTKRLYAMIEKVMGVEMWWGACFNEFVIGERSLIGLVVVGVVQQMRIMGESEGCRGSMRCWVQKRLKTFGT